MSSLWALSKELNKLIGELADMLGKGGWHGVGVPGTWGGAGGYLRWFYVGCLPIRFK